jgi:hypothetical protein
MLRNPNNRYGHVVNLRVAGDGVCDLCNNDMPEEMHDDDCAAVLRHDLDALLKSCSPFLRMHELVGAKSVRIVINSSDYDAAFGVTSLGELYNLLKEHEA